MHEPHNLDLWCLIEGDSACFKIQVAADEDIRVDCLKERVHKKKERGVLLNVDAADLVLWKLKDPVPITPKNTLIQRIPPLSADSYVELDDETETLSVIFVNPPGNHLHIVVPLGMSQSRSLYDLSAQDCHVSKRARLDTNGVALSRSQSDEKGWYISGPLSKRDPFYYVDLRKQAVTQRCLDSAKRHDFLILSGAPASGKTTRLFWLRSHLTKIGFRCLYVSLAATKSTVDESSFWGSINRAMRKGARTCGFPCNFPTISSQQDFLDSFHVGSWPHKLVLLIDELSELYNAPDDLRNDLLRALRVMNVDKDAYAISSVVAAGTFSVIHLSPTDRNVSPFNIADHVQNPYFTLEETTTLFQEFAVDNCIRIDHDVIQDVWMRSSGHPGMVCLCGSAIANNIETLLKGDTLSYSKWFDFTTMQIYDEIFYHNTFRSMVKSLRHANAKDAVDLLRSHFLGFPGDVAVLNVEEDLADFLTTEGVLLRPDPTRRVYRMASVLVDGLIRQQVVAYMFQDRPPTKPPFDNSRESLDVLSAVIESVRCFDKRLIRLAPSCSYKLSKGVVDGSRNVQVPRESVYDTELLRVLSNWLQLEHGWTVTGQSHLMNPIPQNTYTNIIIKKDGQLPTILQVLATGDRDFLGSHIDKTPECMALFNSSKAWLIHFTREDNYHPVWQSDTALNNGVNVLHFCHNLDLTKVLMMARWKDSAGITRMDKETISM